MSDEKWRMEAYYYSFVSTGVDAIDRILSAVAVAGKGCHNTEDWGDYGGGYEHLRGNNFVEMIQNAAIDAADEIEKLTRWKVETEAVEQSWNPQAIAMLLRLPLGSNIRAAIQPTIERLEKENERLKEALRPLADFATNPGPIHITFGDCRAALKALEELK